MHLTTCVKLPLVQLRLTPRARHTQDRQRPQESVQEAQYAGAADRTVSLSFAPTGKVLGGEDYLLQMTIPNVYFHIAMAYAILRHNGVEIGKMDFLGPINWIDA